MTFSLVLKIGVQGQDFVNWLGRTTKRGNSCSRGIPRISLFIQTISHPCHYGSISTWGFAATVLFAFLVSYSEHHDRPFMRLNYCACLLVSSFRKWVNKCLSIFYFSHWYGTCSKDYWNDEGERMKSRIVKHSSREECKHTRHTLSASWSYKIILYMTLYFHDAITNYQHIR